MLEIIFGKVTTGLSIIETRPKESRNAFLVTQGPGVRLQVLNGFNGVETNKNKIAYVIHSFIYPFVHPVHIYSTPSMCQELFSALKIGE